MATTKAGPIQADRLRPPSARLESFIQRGVANLRKQHRVDDITRQIRALKQEAMRQCAVTSEEFDLARVQWREENGKKPKGSVVYFVVLDGDKEVKIGVSSHLNERYSQLRHELKSNLRLIGTVDGDRLSEQAIHYQFREHRIRGEIFDWPSISTAVGNMVLRNSALRVAA